MTALNVMCQTIRTTITVRTTAPATQKYRVRAAGSELGRIGRICKADKDERQHVQHEDDRVPDRVGRERRSAPVCAPARISAAVMRVSTPS